MHGMEIMQNVIFALSNIGEKLHGFHSLFLATDRTQCARGKYFVKCKSEMDKRDSLEFLERN